MKTAMISSTVRDLSDHRHAIETACYRMGFQPVMMEHLAAQDCNPYNASIAMVTTADVYLCVLAFRFGSTPDDDRSYTEIEFDEAVGLGTSILPFFADENTPWPPELFDKGIGAVKLERFKQKVAKGRVVSRFKSPEGLRSEVILALRNFEQEQTTTVNTRRTLYLHPLNAIPSAPQTYIAHPYSLLQTEKVIGRKKELDMLTDWVTKNNEVPSDVRLFNLVALGGVGKSALAWKWFNDIAPIALPNCAGMMWWSFYETDARYDNFLIRALAYVSATSETALRSLTETQIEDRLWQILEHNPFVFVLDGVERILLAYSRMDASRLPDEALDEKTGNYFTTINNLSEGVKQSFTEKRHLRRTANPRAGRFLRRLTQVSASRILLTSRLYPSELQRDTGDPVAGSFVSTIHGLTDDDAVRLWREFKVNGSRNLLLSLFRSFDNYPLLIRALAGEVARYRPAPRDFDTWREHNPGFNPAQLDLRNAKTHVLEYALRGLGPQQRNVLQTLAAFRMPASWDTLRSLLTGGKKAFWQPKHSCADELELDVILTELEDRGLLGWDRVANRYDLHPIVRGVVWAGLGTQAKHGLYENLHHFFDAEAHRVEWSNVQSIDELTPVVELFDKLIGLNRYEDAYAIFRDRLDKATHRRLHINRLRIELLTRFFPNGEGKPTVIGTPHHESQILNWLAAAYHFGGEPGRAASLQRRASAIDERENHQSSLATAFCNLAADLISSGGLCEATYFSRRALVIARQRRSRYLESVALYTLGSTLSACGDESEPNTAFRRSLKILETIRNQTSKTHVSNCLAQYLLWLGRPLDAAPAAQVALEVAQKSRVPHDLIAATRLCGIVSMRLHDFIGAESYLQDALTRARDTNMVKEELQLLIALAELNHLQGNPSLAKDLLDQVWPSVQHGPYPLFGCDANNVLARINEDEGRSEDALTAATAAYHLAWCDGPPYAYKYGLVNARQLIIKLGSDVPNSANLVQSRFKMPKVKVNVKDLFWIDPKSL